MNRTMNENPIYIFNKGTNLKSEEKVLLVLRDKTWQPDSVCKLSTLSTHSLNDNEGPSRLLGEEEEDEELLPKPLTSPGSTNYGRLAKAANCTQAIADLFALETETVDGSNDRV